MAHLERLYLIADLDVARRWEVDVVSVVRDFIRAGGRMVSLRSGDAGDERALNAGKTIASLVYAAGGVFIVHGRADLALVLAADGVHLSSTGMTAAQGRRLMGRAALVGRSCHRREEVKVCASGPVDFITLGPLYESVSKEGYGPQMSLSTFRDVVEDARNMGPLAVYALGGVRPENVQTCMEAGADGVAVLGGIMGSDSPFDATSNYLEALYRHEDRRNRLRD